VILKNSKPDLLVVLGPTASGKTHLAVHLAAAFEGEIISADSRQVYKKMDVGTGKDYDSYSVAGQRIPVHLMDIVEAGEKYNLAAFQHDFHDAFAQIKDKGKMPILCGGSGLYLQSVLSHFWQTQIGNNPGLREHLSQRTREELLKKMDSYGNTLKVDVSSTKRLIRGIEILEFLKENSSFQPNLPSPFSFEIVGLNPAVEKRRQDITDRLHHRIAKQGLIEEVEGLLSAGVPADTLVYYGLEYKYITWYLTGKMTFESMCEKLETEIHRFAKRQMTFFRSMETKGFGITWLPTEWPTATQIDFIKNKFF
jgi:tRNA dimethylallyltransferase